MAEHPSSLRADVHLLRQYCIFWSGATNAGGQVGRNARDFLLSWLMIRSLLPGWMQRPPAAIAIVPGLIALVVTALLMRLGQGGSRIPTPERAGMRFDRPGGRPYGGPLLEAGRLLLQPR